MSDLDLYDATASASAARVLEGYSTSFGWASRLLRHDARQGIANVYALVRIADELVDGPGEQAGLDTAGRGAMLDALEAEVERALEVPFSTNLVVHAFARTARASGIGTDLTRPFFSSMRSDLQTTTYEGRALDDYVHGSAEVVGLMCLAIFESGVERSPAERELLRTGAMRLGAAFQHVNFLRDLAADRDALGRSYVEGARSLDEHAKHAAVAMIEAHLLAADAAIALLRPDCKAAVWAARTIFGDLTRRIASTPAATLARTRVRVPDAVKLSVLARAAAMRIGR